MCKIVEDYAQQPQGKGQIIGAVKAWLEVGQTLDDIVSRLMKNFPMTEDDAMKHYYRYSNASDV